MNAALIHSISTDISTEIAPHSRLVFENATQVSMEATVASVTVLEIARQATRAPPAGPSPSTEPTSVHNLSAWKSVPKSAK